MDTPASLLERLRQPAREQAWARFVELYTPFLYSWVRRLGCPEADTPDLVQEVLILLVRELPAFRYDGTTRLWDAETGQPDSILILFPEDRHLILMPDGHFRGTPGIEHELVCVVLTEDGRQETLTTAAFANKYGWKNDPDKVRLAGK